jgi:hypothetical protein
MSDGDFGDHFDAGHLDGGHFESGQEELGQLGHHEAFSLDQDHGAGAQNYGEANSHESETHLSGGYHVESDTPGESHFGETNLGGLDSEHNAAFTQALGDVDHNSAFGQINSLEENLGGGDQFTATSN